PILFLNMKSECSCIPAELVLEVSDIGILINVYSLNTHGCCPVSHLLCCQVIGERCMMSAACQDPGLSSCLKIGLRCPESSRNWKLRHRFLYFFAFYVINDQTEPIAQIDQRSCDSLSCFRSKYQSCRIFPVSHGKRLTLNADRSLCDSRAYFQHMGFQDALFSRNQVICIVFHKGSSLCIFHSLGHDLHQAHHSRCLPVSFSSESIAFFHKPLDSQARELLQASQISEMSHDRLIILFFQKTFKSKFNLCLNSNMFSEFFRISSLQENVIFAV